MTEKFLKAKHWQLFLLSFGIPMLFQFVVIGSMVANFANRNNTDASFLFSYIKFFPIIMLLFISVLLGWFWSVAIGLQSKLPDGVIMKVKKFKIFFFIPLIYILFIFGFLIQSILGSRIDPEIIVVVIPIIIPLHLFSMFCLFYTLYFVAKTFKTVELQREVIFSDFVGEFFLFWVSPVGIWIVQPKINKMIEK